MWTVPVLGFDFSKSHIYSHESLTILQQVKLVEFKLHLAVVPKPKPIVILKSLPSLAKGVC